MISAPEKMIKKIKILCGTSQSIYSSSIKVIQETILPVKVNGRLLANIACAGIHLEELAAGFLKSEKIIRQKEDIAKIEVKKKSINITLKDTRAIATTCVKNIASSGSRGKTNLELLKPLEIPAGFRIQTGLVLRLMEALLSGSAIHNQTGGTHCSALAIGKKIVALREDIGRHNTIDMLGGYALLNKMKLNRAVILTTGRISSEIVYKVWNMGAPVIISHSAPTANAVRLTQKANITLVGYVRKGEMNIYSQERRIII